MTKTVDDLDALHLLKLDNTPTCIYQVHIWCESIDTVPAGRLKARIRDQVNVEVTVESTGHGYRTVHYRFFVLAATAGRARSAASRLLKKLSPEIHANRKTELRVKPIKLPNPLFIRTDI